MLGKDVTPAITSCAHCLCIIIYIFVIFILQSSLSREGYKSEGMLNGARVRKVEF